MKNTTILFLVGALCILLNQNVFAQDNVKKSAEDPVKVTVKQEQTVKKMVKVEPSTSSQQVQLKQNAIDNGSSNNKSSEGIKTPKTEESSQKTHLSSKTYSQDQNKANPKYVQPIQSTSQRKATPQNVAIQPTNRTTLNSEAVITRTAIASSPNHQNIPTKEDLDKEIIRVKVAIEDMKKSNAPDKEMTLAKLDRTLEHLLAKRNKLFPEQR